MYSKLYGLFSKRTFGLHKELEIFLSKAVTTIKIKFSDYGYIFSRSTMLLRVRELSECIKK
jgi:hypothetical protein